jgi:hypothetical protein
MHKQLFLVFAALALSSVAFAQVFNARGDGPYQIGYAANLNIGDTELEFTNDGALGPFVGAPLAPTQGNICVNVYAFDPSEEEVSCCACLVTPNALVSLSAKNDLINNVLTPAIPTSLVIKLLASIPGTVTGGAATLCNPSGLTGATLFSAATPGVPTLFLTNGLIAWETTMEPNGTGGTYTAVGQPIIQANTSIPGPLTAFLPILGNPAVYGEAGALMEICNFIQSNGSGFGVCNSCALGALSGTKQ